MPGTGKKQSAVPAGLNGSVFAFFAFCFKNHRFKNKKGVVKKPVSGAGCGPKARKEKSDHITPEKRVVPNQRSQSRTTASRKGVWSHSKESNPGPQRPEKACGPTAKKAIPDHSALKKRVVPNQEKQSRTTAPQKSLWSQRKRPFYCALSPVMVCSTMLSIISLVRALST